jgi:ketosteroid isomerase-like protein
MTVRKALMFGALLTIAAACVATRPAVTDEVAGVNSLLDGWHAAAAQADEAAYFARFSPDGVFFGTDASERWKTDAFRAWAHPYFERGRAWTFTPRSRNVYISRSGTVAWFDETLDSASYGECRGTGVLQKHGSEWKIEQYNLTIPIPNELADDFVKKIRELQQK